MNKHELHNASTTEDKSTLFRFSVHVSYTMACSPARGFSYVHVNNHGITTLYHLHQCRPCTSLDIFLSKVGNGGRDIIVNVGVS